MGNLYTSFAIILLETSFFGYCPLYKIFNINLNLEKEKNLIPECSKCKILEIGIHYNRNTKNDKK